MKLILELRDPYTLGHSVRVSKLSKQIAEDAKIKINLKYLQYAALLHDIGKIIIPDSILNKATILSKPERKMVEQHTILGYEAVQNLRIPEEIKESILYHHENYDGTGYPNKIKGNEIPLVARLIKVADVYDALTPDRPRRKSYSEKEAKDIMMKEKNKYEPILLSSFMKLLS